MLYAEAGLFASASASFINIQYKLFMKTKILFITGLILFFAYGYSGNGELSKNGSTANNVNSPAECTPAGTVDAETKENSTGMIIAYNKCPTFNSDSKIDKMRIGLYIKDTDTKEIFLANNLTDSKIAELLGAPVETLEIDLEVKLPATVPVAFSYQKSAGQVEYPCFTPAMRNRLYMGAIQITVFDINRNHKIAKWKVKSLNLSGELANVTSPPKITLYPDMSIQIPDTVKGCIVANTFHNDIWANFEIKGNEQINFKNYYNVTRDKEDDWGLAFENNLQNTVKFNVSNNELVFKDSLDKPVIVFIPK